MTQKDRKYFWVRFGDTKLLNIGILADGSLHNPNGYPETDVRCAVEAAIARQHERRSKAAKKAGVTRARRREKRLHQIAERMRTGQGIGNMTHCYVCGKRLVDPASIARGIGPECWQDVLAASDAAKNSDGVTVKHSDAADAGFMAEHRHG